MDLTHHALLGLFNDFLHGDWDVKFYMAAIFLGFGFLGLYVPGLFLGRAMMALMPVRSAAPSIWIRGARGPQICGIVLGLMALGMALLFGVVSVGDSSIFLISVFFVCLASFYGHLSLAFANESIYARRQLVWSGLMISPLFLVLMVLIDLAPVSAGVGAIGIVHCVMIGACFWRDVARAWHRA